MTSQKHNDFEEQLENSLQLMEAALADKENPGFQNFWEIRRSALPLFQELVFSSKKNLLWQKYTDLSSEAHRLKAHLDEQSSFHTEQLDLAITALEKAIGSLEENIREDVSEEKFFLAQSLEKNKSSYLRLQKELHFLSLYASRMNALRKELLKTDMRISVKNKLFQRVSVLGNAIFPRRKELIRMLSDLFTEDVNTFIQTYFGPAPVKESLFTLREEIKALQEQAKTLTLSTDTFSLARSRLSECWDHLKQEEKNWKKEKADQKIAFKKHADQIRHKIQELQEGSRDVAVYSLIESIASEMRQLSLTREDVREFKRSLALLKKETDEKMKEEEELKRQKMLTLHQERKEKKEQWKKELHRLMFSSEEISLEQMVESHTHLLNSLKAAILTAEEKREMERLMEKLKDIIESKRETRLLSLEGSDLTILQQLKDLLKNRQIQELEMKKRIQDLKKQIGTQSGFDFEKAINLQQQLDEEKERLERLKEGIVEIQSKITAFHS